MIAYHSNQMKHPLSWIYNNLTIHERPSDLKVRNLQIMQKSANIDRTNKSKQKKTEERVEPRKCNKLQIKSYQRNKKVKNQRTNLINKTIQLIYDDINPINYAKLVRITSLSERKNKKKTQNNHNHNRTQVNASSLNRYRAFNYSAMEEGATLGHSIDLDFEFKSKDQKNKQLKQHFFNAFKSIRYGNNKEKQVKKQDGQVLSLSFSRPIQDNKMSANYKKFAQRSIRRVQQARKHTYLVKNRPNTTQVNYEKNGFDGLQPW